MKNIQLIAVFARNPELRYTASGLPVFSGTVAGEHPVNVNGKIVNVPFYQPIQILGKYAELVAERNYQQGHAVAISGELEDNRYEKDGQKLRNVRVRAQEIDGLVGEFPTVQDASGAVRMQGGLSTISVRGNLVRDPELRQTDADVPVLNFSVAVNERWTDKQGKKQEAVHYFNVVVWRELALAMQNLTKGDPVLVTGHLGNQNWTDKDGIKHNETRIEADSVLALQRGAAISDRAGASRPEIVEKNAQPSTQPQAQATADAPAQPPIESDMPF